MSDLRFSCPACGQHIQCDASHAGENLPCPACAVITRVPANAAIVVKPIPSATESASEEKASYAPAEPEKNTEVFPTLEENLQAESGTATPEAPLTEREQQIAAARATHAQAAQAIKPRLSFILSGGAAPAPEENESALSAVEQKHIDAPSHDTKTLHK
jgi:hypothetical protein